MRKGIPYEDGALGLKKKKREALRELKNPVVDRALEILAHLDAATKELDRAIHEEFERSKEAQLLATIPGIGEITVVTLAAYLTPNGRFDNIDQVSASCGLAPSTYQSGNREFHGHLRSDSHHLLRWILIEAGWKTRQFEKRGEVAKAGNRSARKHGEGDGCGRRGAQTLEDRLCLSPTGDSLPASRSGTGGPQVSVGRLVKARVHGTEFGVGPEARGRRCP
ncbi:MAG: IS110 family transposase [Nitrososphaerota archaeon]|jgi:transposase|nr:IS110 family transposase [Nitrososphaerota archaeon]